MHHKTCSNSTFSMRHNAMFEGCWAERLFLKYQNIKICVWKWWAEYLKYQNIQIICVLVPAACFKAGECEYLFSNIKAEHLSRFPPRGSHRLTTGHHLTSSYHVLKHQHHRELKPHHHHVQNYQPHQYVSKFSRRPAPLYSAASLFLYVIFQISKCFMCTKTIKWRTQSFKVTDQLACQRVDCRK